MLPHDPIEEADHSTLSAPGFEGAPDRIGPYALLGKLGEGGMGRVYRAEQTSPVRRQVALKLVRAGMDNEVVLARFESERQALALLNHPNIAQVYDAGTTKDGRPFFAMEYVPGEIVTTYVRDQKVPIRERLELFLQVCDGVQHAHQKGIIHRDLKPSNILVSERDGKPVPKIIDFGVAKATAHRLTDRSLHTMAGQVVGTLAYMSPEQAAGGSLDVDTRSDVYALGMLLYELLAGVHPFGDPSEGYGSYEEYLRKIRTEEPKAPSARLASLGPALEPTAAQAGTDGPDLIRKVHGDLDWITLKAIEKDRSRRYGSASELAEDVRRHLRDEPVTARPPSRIYRFRKFARRNRAGVVAGSLVLTALLLGIVGTSVGMARARRAERAARDEAETSRQTTTFLLDLFNVSGTEYIGRSVTARELLDRGAAKIRTELRDRPLVRATLLQTIGNTYGALGLRREAIPLLTEALQIRRRILGPDHVDTGRSMYDVAKTYIWLEDFDRARPLLESALTILSRHLGPNDPSVAWCHNDLGIGYVGREDYAHAMPHLLEAARIKEKTLGSRNWDYAMSLNNIGYVYSLMHRNAEARQYLKRALDILDAQPTAQANPLIATLLHTLATVLMAEHRTAEARPYLERALAMQESLWVDVHPDIAQTLETMGRADAELVRNRDADSEFRRAVTVYERALGRNALPLAPTLEHYAAFLEKTGRAHDALIARSRASEIRAKHASPPPSPVASVTTER